MTEETKKIFTDLDNTVKVFDEIIKDYDGEDRFVSLKLNRCSSLDKFVAVYLYIYLKDKRMILTGSEWDGHKFTDIAYDLKNLKDGDWYEQNDIFLIPVLETMLFRHIDTFTDRVKRRYGYVIEYNENQKRKKAKHLTIA